ncbi:integrase catalytic domain-containing protein [Trichonephila clavipes]|nr:integrase catalytic domain-containing protein [Trichonephila clavipes]
MAGPSIKQKQTKNKHSGSARARSGQWTMDMQNKLKSTLEGKMRRIETFIKSANEETDSVEIKVKLRTLIALQKNVEELRNNYYAIPNVKDAELTAIDEDLHLLEVHLESLEDQAIEIFKETVEFEKGRYIVQLSFRKSYNENCPIILSPTKQRFQNLWRRFGHDSELYQQYSEIIRDYTEQGIIEEVKTEITDNELKRPVYYLPHQAVRKDGRLTTKTRIVFDAGSHQNNELSLNDCLWTVINLNPNPLDILINFILNAIAFCSDIKQAFLQICLANEHKNAVRILWSDDEPYVHKKPKLQVYRFNRVNFGVSSSPFLLAATIRNHIEKYKQEFPDTVELLDRSFYVDDLISGGNEFEEALQTSRRAKHIMGAAGMDLRKWITNDANLMEQWKKEDFNVHPVHETVRLGANGTKVLGLSWNTNEDYLTTDTKSLLEFVSLDKNTKRFILQAVGKIKGNKTRWKQFIANRVNEITSLTDPHSWYHCAGKENPADFLSRGLSADYQVSNSRWWTGAEFLSDSEFNKNFQQVVPELDYLTQHEKETVVQERKKLPVADKSEEIVLLNNDSSSILDKLLELSNNYFKVINILSYIFRFNYNCRNKSKKVGSLTVAEFKESEIKLIKHAQRSLFDKKEIPSSISNLFLFVDGEGIVRVRGRLENASVPYLHKHPAILPKGSKLSKLYFNSLHTRLFHVGPQGCNVVTPNRDRRLWWSRHPHVHRILQLKHHPFLTPEESNPVDRKMKERCFELTREWKPDDSSSHKLLDSSYL